jgi:hypothetical protein
MTLQDTDLYELSLLYADWVITRQLFSRQQFSCAEIPSCVANPAAQSISIPLHVFTAFLSFFGNVACASGDCWGTVFIPAFTAAAG